MSAVGVLQCLCNVGRYMDIKQEQHNSVLHFLVEPYTFVKYTTQCAPCPARTTATAGSIGVAECTALEDECSDWRSSLYLNGDAAVKLSSNRLNSLVAFVVHYDVSVAENIDVSDQCTELYILVRAVLRRDAAVPARVSEADRPTPRAALMLSVLLLAVAV